MIGPLAALFLAFLTGTAAVALLHPRLSGSALAGTGILTGLGLVTFLLFGSSALSLAWTPSSLFIILVVLAGAGWVLTRAWLQLRPLTLLHLAVPTALLGSVTVAYGLFSCRSAGWNWSIWLPTHRDYFYIWGMKGHAFFEARGIDWGLLRRATSDISHSDYPLFLPLSFDFVALSGNEWNPPLFGLLYATFLLGLLLITYSALREHTPSPLLASLGAIAASGAAILPNVGLADAPLIAFVTAAVVFIRRHLQHGDPADLRLGALLLGLGAWTKNEGLAILLAAAVALLLVSRSIHTVLRLWPAAVVAGPWLVARAVLGLRTDHFAGVLPSIADYPSRLVAVFATLPDVPISKPLFAIAVAVTLALAGPRRLRREGVTLLTVALTFAAYLAVYVVSPHELREHVTGTWGRLQFHLLGPLALIAAEIAVVWISGVRPGTARPETPAAAA